MANGKVIFYPWLKVRYERKADDMTAHLERDIFNKGGVSQLYAAIRKKFAFKTFHRHFFSLRPSYWVAKSIMFLSYCVYPIEQ